MTDHDDLPTLEQDDDLAEPLRRVSYEAGMMLGLEATRDEQAYHRRRLNRHQYWLHGFGTVAGLHVRLEPESHENDTDTVNVHIHVTPGIALDGLGREVLVHETYCIDLQEWLDAQTEATLAEGFALADEQLWLKVTLRHRDCPIARQPVLSRKLNLSTDPVQPSRTADSVYLELIPELPPATETRFTPWGSHTPISDAEPTLTDDENTYLNNVEGTSTEMAERLRLHSRCLRGLDARGVATENVSDELEKGARVLLARLRINTNTLTDILVNPERIGVNNLVRPFVVTASQLAWLRDHSSD
ncbi:hypothetical protein [Marinibactrum halimedae]|uniref:Uncharacterized protein n=1 Tax=Marinibactrum halimedae TaxID=1444977 RepID=A0AA37TF02_9GAMM|nr:hypothetical protein [Marinibactrum halimedae]MCD9460621.1 hypothetical protein [Marinibactrum halimedae]GLS27837.1 hypothetical protein GCM10007877_35560 [Marinibactrum halimedae]